MFQILKEKIIVEETLIRLETNHLIHLQKQIDKIDARVWALIVGVVLQLVSIVFIDFIISSVAKFPTRVELFIITSD